MSFSSENEKYTKYIPQQQQLKEITFLVFRSYMRLKLR